MLDVAACLHSAASAGVARQSGVPPAERAALAEQYAAHAVECLERARATGYYSKTHSEAAALRRDECFDPLRSREDFKRFIRRLDGGT